MTTTDDTNYVRVAPPTDRPATAAAATGESTGEAPTRAGARTGARARGAEIVTRASSAVAQRRAERARVMVEGTGLEESERDTVWTMQPPSLAQLRDNIRTGPIKLERDQKGEAVETVPDWSGVRLFLWHVAMWLDLAATALLYALLWDMRKLSRLGWLIGLVIAIVVIAQAGGGDPVMPELPVPAGGGS